MNNSRTPQFCSGTGGDAEEGAAGLRGPDPDLCAAIAVRREKSDRGQGGHLHQSGQRDSGDQELHECRLQGRLHLLRVRQQGKVG